MKADLLLTLKSNEEALEVIIKAIETAGYKPGDDIMIALDVASSELYKDGFYYLNTESSPKKSAEEMIEYYTYLTSKYPIISIEDGLDEEDWNGWKKLTDALGKKVQLVGDDLFVTNTRRLVQGIDQKVGNAILVKVNQIGTIQKL